MVGQHIVNFFRQTQSAQALRLALCEVAQLAILPEDGTLLFVYQNDRRVTYTFDTCNITVNYPHELLSTGILYPKNTIIGGEYIQVYSQTAGEPEQWWRTLDWSEGLTLSGPFAGLVIPDALVRFYWVSDWIDSTGATRKHIQADFDPTHTTLAERFWYQIHTAEERTEITLTDTDALSAVDDGTDITANMLDFYFRNLYGARGIVVDLRTGELGDKIDRAVRSFLHRETPIGSIIIIRDNGAVSPDFL